MLIVQKFGGSSLADAQRLRRAAMLCLEARRRGCAPVLVVSAAGDSTDELLAMARSFSPDPPARELDALLSTGEQQSAALMAILLSSLGAPARSFTGWQAGVHTDETHGRAAIRLLAPGRLTEALARGEIPVVAGFQGLSPAGDVSTLGRGGSDTTTVALAAALDAARCEIYTDVDGIYTADPRLVPGARLLPVLDFRDMLRLAQAGSQVLHPDSVALAMAGDVELHLLSSFRPGPGSLLRALPEEERPAFAGVTRDEARGTVSAVGKAAGEDALAALLQLLADAGIPVEDAVCREGRVDFKVAPAQLLPALRLLHSALFSEDTGLD